MLDFVVDSSYGSSGKGAVATRLADRDGLTVFTSTNMKNAGHTAVVDGFKFITKILPTPLVLARKYPQKQFIGYIGPSANFDVAQLYKEIEEANIHGNVKIVIHPRAVIVDDHHVEMERNGVFSTKHLASTMTGSGYAMAEKLMRLPSVVFAETLENTDTLTTKCSPHDFAYSLREDIMHHGGIHEVSQGYALSLNYGTHYPSCTSRDCTPMQGLNDLGLTPDFSGDVYLNVRSFPIRVGNVTEDGMQKGFSGGHWHDQEETSWEKIAIDAGMPEDVAKSLYDKELTTVTKRLRRVFTPSWDWLSISAEMLGANKMILNFPQYIDHSCAGLRGGPEMLSKLHPKVRAYIDQMENTTGLKLNALCTGADHDDVIWLD